MRKTLRCLAIIVFLLAGSLAYAFTSGSTGADGAFNPTSDTQLQLPPDGIFNFTTVNVPSGVTVTFTRNEANTPVYILATGDVVIAGTIDVSGENGISITGGKGGPGGFDGGYGGNYGTGGDGLGPGGGLVSTLTNCGMNGGGGSFGSAGGSNNGGSSGSTYGNHQLIPLIGGSGGAGGNVQYCEGIFGGTGPGAGGGGGAILIASSGTISVTGSILAKGGIGACSNNCGSAGGCGSGGAIKLMASTIAGNGKISAAGGSGDYNNNGGNGRIRLEADDVTRTASTSPGYTFGAPGPIFIANAPSIQITSIAGVNVPENPTGSYESPDVTLPAGTTNPVEVGISASNIPVGTIITVSAVPQLGAASSAQSSALSGTLQSSTANASVSLSTSEPCVLMAETTFDVQTAMNYKGEKITKAKVVASLGGGSRVTYITASGKKVSATELYASLTK